MIVIETIEMVLLNILLNDIFQIVQMAFNPADLIHRPGSLFLLTSNLCMPMTLTLVVPGVCLAVHKDLRGKAAKVIRDTWGVI